MGNGASTQAPGDVNADGDTVMSPVTAGDTTAADTFNSNGGDSHLEEKKDDQHPTSYKSRRNRRSGDKKMANGKDIWNSNAPAHVQDEHVHVNLGLADFLAYLQVVANNSNHLPLTKRDDPELDRSINELTAEEYARKSAAFVPADVRVIGGVFTRYGRVWDLPTSAVSVVVASAKNVVLRFEVSLLI
jgi:hypothetical protein